MTKSGQEPELTDQERAKRTMSAHLRLVPPPFRGLYDQVGELATEDPFAQNSLKNIFRKLSGNLLPLFIWFLLCVGTVQLFLILFCVKVDGNTSASWVALWTPLWVFNAIGLWYYAYLVSVGTIKPPEGMEDGWRDPYPMPLRFLGLVKWTLLIVFQIFLTLRLDDDIDWSYAVVGSPLLAWMGLTLFSHLYAATRRLPDDRIGGSTVNDVEGGVRPSQLDARKRVQAIAIRIDARLAIAKDCVWTMQLVFLILKLDEHVDWNWWVVFLPTWLVFFGRLAGLCLRYPLAIWLYAGMEEEDRLTNEEKKRKVEASQLLAHPRKNCGAWIFAVVTVVLAVNAIAGADYSAFVIFIPQFIGVGTLLCCMSCATCFFCCTRGLRSKDVPDRELQGGSGISAPY